MIGQTIDIPQAVDHLRRLIEREGFETVATNPTGNGACTYAVKVDGRLSSVCLIGRLFDSWGLLGLLLDNPFEGEDGYRNEPNQFAVCTVDAGMWDRLSVLGVNVTVEARNFFRRAQELQDSGLSWGHSFNAAFAETRANYLNDAAARFDSDYGRSLEDPVFGPASEAPLADWERELLYPNPWDNDGQIVEHTED